MTLFAHDSVWNRPLADNAPIDPQSPAIVAELAHEIFRERQLAIGPWYIPAARYVVPAAQPTVSVALSNPTVWWRAPLAAALQSVPLPAGAVPTSNGGDNELTVWQPDSNRLWEVYHLAKNTAGGWTADWGGAMSDVSSSPGYYNANSWPGAYSGWGATATSLPHCAGLVLYQEAKALKIPHAITVHVPYAKAGVFAWPAQRHDATQVPGASLIPEGARIRIDPSLDLSKLGLTPFQLALATAIQRYGMVVRDQTGQAFGFVVEDTAQYNLGFNPWYGSTGALLGSDPKAFFAALPWQSMQVLSMELYSTAIG